MNKVGIIGDVHLGASIKAGQKDTETGIPSRLLDYKDTLMYAISYVAKQCKTVIFTGDIFEHRFPHMVQQQIFSECLFQATSLGIEKIYILIGNHDQQRTSSTTTLAYLSELKLENIIVIEDPTTIDMDGHKIHFLPYRDRKYFGVTDYDMAIEKTDEICKELAKNNGTKSNVMIGHMAIEGTFFSEEEAELYTDNELMMKKVSFLPFDLTVMGHVHTPALISQNPVIYYVGSLEKRGAFESHEKQLMIVDLDSKETEYHSLPCRKFFEYKFAIPKSGVDFQKILFETLATYSKEDKVKDNIVKCEITMKSDDIGHYNPENVRQFFLDKGCSFAFPPKISVESDRVIRSTLIETSSDTDTWTKHISANVTDPELRANLIQIGSEIIAEVES